MTSGFRGSPRSLFSSILDFSIRIGGGATGTIRPSTSPRMPSTGFEVRGRIVRQRSARSARVHFEVDGRGQEFAVVRRRSPQSAGVAVPVAVKSLDGRLHPNDGRGGKTSQGSGVRNG